MLPKIPGVEEKGVVEPEGFGIEFLLNDRTFQEDIGVLDHSISYDLQFSKYTEEKTLHIILILNTLETLIFGECT